MAVFCTCGGKKRADGSLWGITVRTLIRKLLLGTASVLALGMAGSVAIAKTPEKHASHHYGDRMRAARTCQFGKAVRYALLGRKTASGEMLDSVTATAAHRSLPLDSFAKVTDLDNGRSVIVKINDRGPHVRGRIIDLSPRAADALHMKAAGVAAVVVQPGSNPAETKHRCFPEARYSDMHHSQRPGPVSTVGTR